MMLVCEIMSQRVSRERSEAINQQYLLQLPKAVQNVSKDRSIIHLRNLSPKKIHQILSALPLPTKKKPAKSETTHSSHISAIAPIQSIISISSSRGFAALQIPTTQDFWQQSALEMQMPFIAQDTLVTSSGIDNRVTSKGKGGKGGGAHSFPCCRVSWDRPR